MRIYTLYKTFKIDKITLSISGTFIRQQKIKIKINHAALFCNYDFERALVTVCAEDQCRFKMEKVF
jgi:hypothetical protein